MLSGALVRCKARLSFANEKKWKSACDERNVMVRYRRIDRRSRLADNRIPLAEKEGEGGAKEERKPTNLLSFIAEMKTRSTADQTIAV